MDAIEAILTRRSIRKFTSDPIPERDIKDLLEAAMSAPSAGNERPWHFVVLKNRQVLDGITQCHPYAQAVKEASVAILVCGDTRLEKFPGCMIQDLSAATENILIAIRAKGLGAVWLGIHPEKDRIDGVRNLLNLPQHVMPHCVIPLGIPAENKPPANRYERSRIHYDSW
jgi:nitroreductase